MAILKDTQINGNLSIGGGTVADFVVERGKTENGWYTIWNSGFKECGGIIQPLSDTYVTITYPVTFSQLPVLHTTFLYSYDGTGLYEYLSPRNTTTTSFTIKNYINHCNGTAWTAKGY